MNRWHEYEARKAAWLSDHPSATPQEIREAMKTIAKELGL